MLMNFIDSPNNAWFPNDDKVITSKEKYFTKFFHYLVFGDVNPFFNIFFICY